MIVEFIGTPGSGKTTLVPVVTGYLNEIGFQAYPVLDAARPFAKRTLSGKLIDKILPMFLLNKILWQIYYFSSYLNRRKFYKKNRALMEEILQFQEQRPISRYDRHHVIHWFIHLTGNYEFFLKYLQPKDVVIFDEGFVHRVVQLFASENEEPDFELMVVYLNLIPKPDLVIFTNTPYEICKERVFSRGIWERFRKKEPEDTSKFIFNASKVVNFSVDYLRKKGWNIIEVQNGHDDISTAEKLLKNELSKIIV